VVKRTYTLKVPSARVAYDISYEEHLNEEQLEVVLAEGGPMLVLAGAGTGKTRTLTYRVARLLESGVSPDRILLVTFTNRASREMINRVGTLLGEVPRGLWAGTFHSIGNRILRRHADKLDYPREFTILDSEDTQVLMSLAVTDAEVDVTKRRFPRGRVLHKLYSLARNRAEPLAEVILKEAPYFAEMLVEIERVTACYERRKKQVGAMDYDDLLVNWKKLFTDHDEVLREYGERFKHVLVDEYQDTNHVQGIIVDLCASVQHNLTVVGDDCQSIYRFRGADYNNILEFPKRHAGTRIFKLQTNYRSTPQVLAIANDSIRYNSKQFRKVLKGVQPEDVQPAVVACKNVRQQAVFVAQRALEIRDEGVELNRIAVLYRAHYQAMELQVELTKRGIPYIVRSGVRFFEQAHIKDVLAYMRLVQNPKDELAFHRVLKTADGIGKKLSNRIWRQLHAFEDPSDGWSADGIVDDLPKRAAASWDRNRRLLLKLTQMSRAERNPSEYIDLILDGGYRAHLRKSFDNVESRVTDLQQLGNYASQHNRLDQFLNETSLQSSIAAEDVVESGELDEYLVLSSIHQAKGLEFHTVFLIWLAAGRFPSPRAETELDGIEEERRLFYVAVTRAQNELYLCHPIMARERERGMTLVRPSQFIDELNDKLYETWTLSQE
jgi:DNA helicase-2/ATP-dependent DNA helicase PcrA